MWTSRQFEKLIKVIKDFHGNILRKQQKQPPGSCLVKEILIKILQNSRGNTYVGVFFWKRCWPEARNFCKKRTLTKVFS